MEQLLTPATEKLLQHPLLKDTPRLGLACILIPGLIDDVLAIVQRVTIEERTACAKAASFVSPSDAVLCGDIGQMLGFNEAQGLISKAIRARNESSEC